MRRVHGATDSTRPAHRTRAATSLPCRDHSPSKAARKGQAAMATIGTRRRCPEDSTASGSARAQITISVIRERGSRNSGTMNELTSVFFTSIDLPSRIFR